MSDPKKPGENTSAEEPFQAPGELEYEPSTREEAPLAVSEDEIADAIAEAGAAVETAEEKALDDEDRRIAQEEADAIAAAEAEAWAAAERAAAEKAAAEAAAAKEAEPGAKGEELLVSFGYSAPFAILAYCLALAALRLGFSPFLEADESEFVGRVDFRLIYDNAHPPLFNWATRILLNLTGWSWPEAIAILKYGLLAGFHYLTWSAATRVAGPRAGAIALAASAFLPQIVWMSATTLAHSIMVLTGTAAVLYCALLCLRRPDWRSYAWLGAAMSLGALAKFNFFLLLVPFFAAFALDREGRRLFTQPFAWVAPAVFAATTGPSLIAAAIYVEDSGSRIGKLYQPSKLAWLDLPYLGVDGFVSLIVIALAWAGPAALIWGAALFYDNRHGGLRAPSTVKPFAASPYTGEMLGRVLERALALGMALTAILVLASDVTKLEERYLTPLLALLPVYLALRWPLGASAKPILLLAIAAYLAVFVGFWGMVAYGKHRYSIPYKAVAAQIRRQSPQPLPLIATRHEDRANLLIALGWPGASTPSFQKLENGAMLVWPGRNPPPEGLAPEGFGPATPITTVAEEYLNGSGREAVYSFQRFERTHP